MKTYSLRHVPDKIRRMTVKEFRSRYGENARLRLRKYAQASSIELVWE